MKTALLFIASAVAAAQDLNMSGPRMVDMNTAGMSLMNIASGTSLNPVDGTLPMFMTPLRNWNTMLMGTAFIVDTQQSGPRGGDKLYSPNWLMGSAEHSVGSKGAFQVDLMLSLEAATITGERYPLLFQTGETAYGRALYDAQHPHNFIMALGFHYAYTLTENTTLDVYVAPVGDPALGPVAYPHRASAEELPEATLSHHLQDSTHISDDVITVGISRNQFRLEASGFHGAEPGENRWIIQQGRIDSYSGRLWYLPNKHWAAQVSAGRITHPEALEPGDQVRTTASVSYTSSSHWSTSLIWGRNHDTFTQHNNNAYLAESVLSFAGKNFLTGRIELVDKDELFPTGPPDQDTFRIGAYTLGYTRDVSLFSRVETGIGANFSFYTLPDAIKPIYGNHPVGGNIFIRLRLRKNS